MQQLINGTLLQGGRYRILDTLGQGGFGITYLAIQSGLERKVAIKEFFMKELCERDESTSHVTLGTEGTRETVSRFREKFLKEARNIAKLNHPNIVRIIDVFEENGTAYYVMEYAENGSLADKVKKQGYLSEPVATRYILQVASALGYIHKQKMNHLDVKPANIMLNEKDEAVLIDFGLSKQYDVATGNQTSTTPVGISEGYAPMEQYMQGGVGAFSPQTDIYSLGATFYKLLTGITPPNSSFVNDEGVPTEELTKKGVSQSIIDIICKAMEGRKRDRLKDVATFIEELNTYTSSSSETFAVDDDATISTLEMQRVEEEHKRNEAEAKTTKERTNVERKVQEEVECKLTHQNSKLRNKASIWIAIGLIAIVAVVIGIYNYKSSDSLDHRDSTMASSKKQEISYNNGILTIGNVSYKMIHIDGGTFKMGTNSPGPGDTWTWANPEHPVTLKNFSIGETEVTQALWNAVMGNNPSEIKGENLPVDFVFWYDAMKFAKKLSNMTGKHFRLPTEAEWEYAARGGQKGTGTLYAGSNNKDETAWHVDNSNGEKPHPVAQKKPNELGLYDMIGNVQEWCQDKICHYPSTHQTNPIALKNPVCNCRILRGGGYRDTYLDVFTRSWSEPVNDGFISPISQGVRLVVDE